jgi:plastocyanin
MSAQSLFEVSVGGTSFAPSSLTINKGDTVRWTNSSVGQHNVNGTLATFPSNPEPFGNSVGSNWTYEHVFLNPGNFNYRCDVHFSMGMVGDITVTNINATDDKAVEEKLVSSVYPSPASEQVVLELSREVGPGWTLSVFDLTGQAMTKAMPLIGIQIKLDTSAWGSGVYFYQLDNGKGVAETGTIVVQ